MPVNLYNNRNQKKLSILLYTKINIVEYLTDKVLFLTKTGQKYTLHKILVF
jgi:hypothetical protein